LLPKLDYTPRGIFVALILLLGVEIWLHTDDFLYRYRSVFAVGRAMDKIQYVEATTPRLIIAGNSRVDNGFDARRVGAILGLPSAKTFNLGLPGANARHLEAIFERFDQAGMLGPGRIEQVVLGLDEAMLQAEDSLGYGVFFSNRRERLAEKDLAGVLAATFRLWGYAPNFKELREPEKAGRFAQATFKPIEPVGGAARDFQGYRAGFGAGRFQNAAQVAKQEETAMAPPDLHVMHSFLRLLHLLQQRSVRVAVVFPPLLQRDVLYLNDSLPSARPYRAFANQIASAGVPGLVLDSGAPHNPIEFITPGHLNDQGAQRYSALLGGKLAAIWHITYQVQP
jgi:hypothetical protein